MCSFLVTNILNFILEYVNFYLKYRGPDGTNIKTINGIKFIHNLLHITGKKTLQPFIDTDYPSICNSDSVPNSNSNQNSNQNSNIDPNIVVLFNGEIYNYQEFNSLNNESYDSDGECIIPLYKKYGDDFIHHLYGEFAVVLFDFQRNLIILSTDIFSTKPLWYCFDKNKSKFAIASYASAIKRLGFNDTDIVQLKANTTIFVDMDTLEINSNMTKRVYEFDLNQHKTTFDDWEQALINSITIRTKNSSFPFFIGLSSGYDSGGICCCLNNLNIKYESYSICGGEDVNTIVRRIDINNKNKNKGNLINLNLRTYKQISHILSYRCEDFKHFVLPNQQKPYSVLGDGASAGMATIFIEAKRQGYKYFLSGQGADEIFSDYGHNGIKFKHHSFFGGKFPNDLNNFFPWHSVFDGVQKCFIAKEEYVSGAFGIEGRYPYLDKNVVQEFLWLDSKLKNSFYKSPLHHFLTKNNYPFKPNVKVGFSRPWN